MCSEEAEEKAALVISGGGPPPATFPQAQDLTIANNTRRPEVEGAVRSDPGGSLMSTLYIFIYHTNGFDCPIKKTVVHMSVLYSIELFQPLMPSIDVCWSWTDRRKYCK